MEVEADTTFVTVKASGSGTVQEVVPTIGLCNADITGKSVLLTPVEPPSDTIHAKRDTTCTTTNMKAQRDTTFVSTAKVFSPAAQITTLKTLTADSATVQEVFPSIGFCNGDTAGESILTTPMKTSSDTIHAQRDTTSTCTATNMEAVTLIDNTMVEKDARYTCTWYITTCTTTNMEAETDTTFVTVKASSPAAQIINLETPTADSGTMQEVVPIISLCNADTTNGSVKINLMEAPSDTSHATSSAPLDTVKSAIILQLQSSDDGSDDESDVHDPTWAPGSSSTSESSMNVDEPNGEDYCTLNSLHDSLSEGDPMAIDEEICRHLHTTTSPPVKAVLEKADDTSRSMDPNIEVSEITPVAPSKGISVQFTTTENKKQKWDKIHACKYCGKTYFKLARHLETCHAKEFDVQKVLSYPKKSAERKQAWATIRNDGDYEHNFSVLKNNQGTIIPKYRPSREYVKDASAYLPCSYCKAMFVRKELSYHQGRCQSKPEAKIMKRNQAVKEGRLLVPTLQDVTDSFFLNVINSMKNDEVTSSVKNDSLILTFGKRKWEKKDVEEHTANYVSNKMRELARLIITGRQQLPKANFHSLQDFLDPKNFYNTIEAVKLTAGYDKVTRKYTKPSLALCLGYSLNRCAQILHCDGLMENDERKCDHGQKFMELYHTMWADSISAGALQVIDINKTNQIKLLPMCEDVQTVYSHVKNKSAFFREKVQEDASCYPEFVRYSQCEITMFNRKRGGEVQRIKVTDIESAMIDRSPPDKEVEQSLTQTEIKLCSIMKRVEFRGKFGCRVALLLTPNMLENVKMMLEVRVVAQIEGPYLFCRPHSERPYRGCDSLRETLKEVELKQPEGFNYTSLRKHMATMSQVFELSETGQDQLAQFMGHSIRVHRDFYRLPLDLVQRAKITKILLAVNEGTHGQQPAAVKQLTLEDVAINADGE